MVKEMAAIVAVAAQSRGIGYKGDLPWKLPADMRHFQKVTMDTTAASEDNTQNAVVMGRKTWESIPEKFRPLKGRINVVLTRSAVSSAKTAFPDGVIVASSLQDASDKLEAFPPKSNIKVGKVFVMGGSQIYEQAMKSGFVNKVICTNVYDIPETTKFDAFFPDMTESEWACRPYYAVDKENAAPVELRQKDEKSGLSFEFMEYARKNPIAAQASNDSKDSKVVNTEEMQYLDLCREIIESGIQRGDRTGTGTLSKFGTQMRFSLRDGTLPLLTTKRTFWRGVAEELLWFISVSFSFFWVLVVYCKSVESLDLFFFFSGRETPMQTSWLPRTFTFGMEMAHANFWINAV